MRVVIQRYFLLALCILAVTACSKTDNGNKESRSVEITLVPYKPEETLPFLLASQQSTVESTMTPEPLTYTVVAGDSMSVIALRFGIDLKDLMAANPSVNPNAMSIGTKLIIPPAVSDTQSELTALSGLPTPVVQVATPPDCYRMATSEWLCFLFVRNDQAEAIENVMGQIKVPGMPTIFPATCPLDLIQPGDSVPLISIINLAEFDPGQAQAILTSAIPVKNYADRFGTTQIVQQLPTYSDDLLTVEVSGEILLSEGGYLRLLGFATDNNDHILGYRIWDAPQKITAGGIQKFRLTIFSLGDKISNIQLVSQARLE